MERPHDTQPATPHAISSRQRPVQASALHIELRLPQVLAAEHNPSRHLDWHPRLVKKERELRLAPTRKMLAMSQAGDQDYYDARYIKILERLDPEEVFETLTLAGTRQVAILCWCARRETCHRRYAAEWFEAYLGIVVPEYGVPRKETETFWDWSDAT